MMQLSKKKKRKKPLVSQIEHEEERPLLHSQGPRGATHRTNTGRKMAAMTTDTSLCAYLTLFSHDHHVLSQLHLAVWTRFSGSLPFPLPVWKGRGRALIPEGRRESNQPPADVCWL